MSAAERWGWRVGAGGCAVAALGWALDAAAFQGGWLAAVTLVAGWPLGSIALLLVHPLTGGAWGEALRPALRTGVHALPLLLPAALPLALGLPSLYEWARPGAHVANAFYLNVPFFEARAALYLVVWFALGALALRGRGLAAIAPVGLFLLGLTVSFAAIDTTMSLDPRFVSSIHGMLTAAGMVLLALSMAVLLAAGGADPGLRADLGKLLLALMILWTYLDFMQLLIVWQSNLVAEAPWYLARSRGAWGALRGVIVLGHFALPLALLLSARGQRSRRVVLGVAGLLVAMEMLRAWWTVLPSLGRQVGWIDVACMAGLGGVAVGLALRAARSPALAGGVRHV